MTTQQSAAAPSAAGSANPAPPSSSGARRNALGWIVGLFCLVGLIYGGVWWSFSRGVERTDNAYVHAPMVSIAAQQAGAVTAITADDTEQVQVGQVLVRLDPAEARLARERAEARLAQAVRETRTAFAQDATLVSAIRVREAELERLRAEEARAGEDLSRRQPLLVSGAIGAEEIAHAQASLAMARAARLAAQSSLEAARDQRSAHRVQIEGLRIDQHPTVLRAATELREAMLVESRNEILAPVSGQVARRSVQVGQRIAAGQTLLSIVPLEQVWVEANFKEVQLRDMRVGQAVSLRADLHGSAVEYRGRVAGVGAGTGAAFAVLPAQNASGNWVKVVQRVPVRIELDAEQLVRHPLRVGLSMHVTVDVSGVQGPTLSDFKVPDRSRDTAVYERALASADERVRAVIARHSAGAIRRAP